MTQEIVNTAHLGARAFEEIGGEVVQTTSFVIRNANIGGNGVYFRLVDSKDKEKDFVDNLKNSGGGGGGRRFVADATKLITLPGQPLAYWLSEKFISIFNNKTLAEYADARIGMVTGDNERFLRRWSEVDYTKSYYTATDLIKSTFIDSTVKIIECAVEKII